MNKDLYPEKLAWFKQNEKPEAVLVVADNPDLVKIVIAWTNLDVKPTGELTSPLGESESETWEWLWKNARFSIAELKEKVGISFSELALVNKMKPLIGNRVIYPDGTVNSFVQRYLREQVLKLFEEKPKKPAKKG
jgi:hypothetical protein